MLTIRQHYPDATETSDEVASYNIARGDNQITVTGYSEVDRKGDVVKEWAGLEGSGRTTEIALFILNAEGAVISHAYVVPAE